MSDYVAHGCSLVCVFLQKTDPWIVGSPTRLITCSRLVFVAENCRCSIKFYFRFLIPFSKIGQKLVTPLCGSALFRPGLIQRFGVLGVMIVNCLSLGFKKAVAILSFHFGSEYTAAIR